MKAYQLLLTLLAEIRLALLHGGHHHVTTAASGQAVQARPHTHHRDNVQVLGPSVIGAVHHGSHRQTA